MAASDIVIAKPETHRREYAYVELPNRIKVILGSDPNCDKAGAALCVNVGMCYERKDLPGLAHFLEHMLFTGTTKYPKEGEYHEFIKHNGGRANAYTMCYMTNYMLEVKPDKLEGALDRFSRFFSEPLLTRDCTAREINAVDSEFQAGHTMPWWRYVGIMNMSANKDHPFHVAVGNNKVLLEEPRERGIDLYDEMLKFYREFYSANGMTLCVIGRESLDELRGMVTERFASIEDKGLQLPLGSDVSPEPPFLPQEWNRLLLQAPVKDVKQLAFSWVIPYQAPNWRYKPSGYVSHLLGHEGKGSMTALLKERGLITSCFCGNGAWLEGAFSLMVVTFDLTDQGVQAVQEIGDVLFTYIGMLQKCPVEQWILEELKQLRQIQFQFGEDRRPFELAQAISESLQRHPPSEVLAGGVLYYDFDLDATKALIDSLKLDGVRVSHMAKTLLDRCTDKDTSYDSPMAFIPLEAEWLTAWTAALGGDLTASDVITKAAVKGLHLPNRNPFIPEDLAVKALPEAKQLYPRRLTSLGAPMTYVFHRQDDVFRQPKAHALFQIRSPYINSDAANYVKTELWCYSLEEVLNVYSYDSMLAGLSYSLAMKQDGLLLAIAGFHDKLPVLLKEVCERMRTLSSIPTHIYQIVADSYGDYLQNVAYHSRPLTQSMMLFTDLLFRNGTFPVESKLNAFRGLSRGDLDGVCDQIFAECHVEALVLGNETEEDAGRLVGELTRALRLEQRLSALPQRAEAALPPGTTLWSLKSTDVDDPNNAVRACLQIRSSVADESMMMLLSNILEPKFFDVLRTQQQLGYIVSLSSPPHTHFASMLMQVQTEFPVDYVRGRINAFLAEHFEWVDKTLSEEEFQTCRAGLLSELQTKPKNLGEEINRCLRQFMNRKFDFEYRQRLIDYLQEHATLESLRSFVREKVLSASRLYIQLSKVLDKPDKELPEGATVPEDLPDMRRWQGRDDEAVAAFAASTEWMPLNSAI